MNFSIPKPHISPLSPNLNFTPEQIHQLHQQIQAFKTLNNSQTLSSSQITHIKRLSPEEWEKFNFAHSKLLTQSKARQVQETYDTSNRQVPGKIEPKTVSFYYELRLKELDRLLLGEVDPEMRDEIMKEKYMIKLRDIQNKLRKKVLEEWHMRGETQKDQSHKALELSLLDRDFYMRVGQRPDIRAKQEAKIISRYEQSMRNGLEHKKKTREREFLCELMNHHREFFEFHKKKHSIYRKNIYGSKSQLDLADRKEMAEQEKADRERLRILKENDMTTYIEMLATAKNERLIKILEQTDGFLRKLGAKVLVQKGETNEEDLIPEEQQTESITDKLKKSSSMYYEITHTISEEIKEQPKGIEGGQLKSYQLIGLQWLISLYNNKLHGILADEMGLGKTIQTISLFQYLIDSKNNHGPFLVVTPLSTVSNWVLEFKRWTPKIKVVIYKGPPAHRKQIINTALTSRKFNVLLTTYEYIIKDKQQLSKVHWSYIVVDEGHRMKNAKSKFAQILGLQYQSDHRLLLTGTPLQNNLAELWALLNFLLPSIFNSLDDFEKFFNQPFSKIPGEKNLELNEEESLLVINRLHQVLRPFLLRRVKKEVEAELPDKVEFVLKVKLSSWQERLYKDIQDKEFISRESSSWKCKTLNNSVMQLRKVCNHPYLFLNPDQINVIDDEIWRCSGKFELLDRMLPKFIATGHKILIFTQMTQLMDIMALYFDYRGFRYLRLDGSTKVEDRDARMSMFNAPNSEYRIFLLSTRAGGLGLNLQTADTVIIYDSDWNPMMDLQAQDRAHRIGQKQVVRVYRLVTSTVIEETILTKAAYKKDVDAKVIQAGLFNTKATDKERNERLRNLLRTEENDDSGDEEEFLDDATLNKNIARTEEELTIFEQMDYERRQKEPYKFRLIQDEKLPEWLTIQETYRKDIFEYGRGMRQRKNIVYTDFGDYDLPRDGKKRNGSPLEDSGSKRSKYSESEEVSEVGSEVSEGASSGMKITISNGKLMNESDSELSDIEEGIIEEDEIYEPMDNDSNMDTDINQAMA